MKFALSLKADCNVDLVTSLLVVVKQTAAECWKFGSKGASAALRRPELTEAGLDTLIKIIDHSNSMQVTSIPSMKTRHPDDPDDEESGLICCVPDISGMIKLVRLHLDAYQADATSNESIRPDAPATEEEKWSGMVDAKQALLKIVDASQKSSRASASSTGAALVILRYADVFRVTPEQARKTDGTLISRCRGVGALAEASALELAPSLRTCWSYIFTDGPEGLFALLVGILNNEAVSMDSDPKSANRLSEGHAKLANAAMHAIVDCAIWDDRCAPYAAEESSAVNVNKSIQDTSDSQAPVTSLKESGSENKEAEDVFIDTPNTDSIVNLNAKWKITKSEPPIVGKEYLGSGWLRRGDRGDLVLTLTALSSDFSEDLSLHGVSIHLTERGGWFKSKHSITIRAPNDAWAVRLATKDLATFKTWAGALDDDANGIGCRPAPRGRARHPSIVVNTARPSGGSGDEVEGPPEENLEMVVPRSRGRSVSSVTRSLSTGTSEDAIEPEAMTHRERLIRQIYTTPDLAGNGKASIELKWFSVALQRAVAAKLLAALRSASSAASTAPMSNLDSEQNHMPPAVTVGWKLFNTILRSHADVSETHTGATLLPEAPLSLTVLPETALVCYFGHDRVCYFVFLSFLRRLRRCMLLQK